PPPAAPMARRSSGPSSLRGRGRNRARHLRPPSARLRTPAARPAPGNPASIDDGGTGHGGRMIGSRIGNPAPRTQASARAARYTMQRGTKAAQETANSEEPQPKGYHLRPLGRRRLGAAPALFGGGLGPHRALRARTLPGRARSIAALGRVRRLRVLVQLQDVQLRDRGRATGPDASTRARERGGAAMSGRLIAQSGTLPDGRSYTVYRGSALRWLGPYPCEAGNRPHDLGEPEPRPWGAAGYSRPIQAGCRICGSIVTVGWTEGPVFYTDE